MYKQIGQRGVGPSGCDRSFDCKKHRGPFPQRAGFRRHKRFEKVLIALKELGTDVKPIAEILVALKAINVSKLDKTRIVEQIAGRRLSVIGGFLNPTK